MSSVTDHPWELLKNAWPFDKELREVPAWNDRFDLDGPNGFDATLRPVFLVGDLEGRTDYLFIGMKPGLGSETNPAFRAERAALTSANFETYRESRRNYFLSPALNRNHYWPVAKTVAA